MILAYPSELGHFTSFLQVLGHDGKTWQNWKKIGLGSDFEYQKSVKFDDFLGVGFPGLVFSSVTSGDGNGRVGGPPA